MRQAGRPRVFAPIRRCDGTGVLPVVVAGLPGAPIDRCHRDERLFPGQVRVSGSAAPSRFEGDVAAQLLNPSEHLTWTLAGLDTPTLIGSTPLTPSRPPIRPAVHSATTRGHSAIDLLPAVSDATLSTTSLQYVSLHPPVFTFRPPSRSPGRVAAHRLDDPRV
jgi:hypothetical protein